MRCSLAGGLTTENLLATCWQALRAGGRLVANAVTVESEQMLLHWHSQQGGELTRMAIQHAEPIGQFLGMESESTGHAMDSHEIIASDAQRFPSAQPLATPTLPGYVLCRWGWPTQPPLQMPDQPRHSLLHIRDLFPSWQWSTLDHHHG